MSQTFVDQMGRSVRINQPVERIVSLVPSQTELLHYLGMNERVVGITKFCKEPATWYKKKVKVGGTKKVKPDVIKKLKPDLIIGNKEENSPEDIKQLERQYPVWMSNVFTLDDANAMIRSIGELTGTEERANDLVTEIQSAFQSLESLDGKRVAYFIWKRPYMVAGANTFINTMLQAWGAENVFGSVPRYPEVKAEDIRKREPEVILLSTEPYPFKQRHAQEMRKVYPAAKVAIADGRYFSWYGSRLKDAPTYLNKIKGQLEG